jgi:FKBP-type peptidyl-prolyl cis-trans isomerase FklB
MKKIVLSGIILLVLMSLQSCNKTSFSSKPKNASDSACYMIGISVGHSMKMQNLKDIDPDFVAKGIAEVMKNDSAISMQDANVYLNKFFTELRDKQALENTEKGDKYLAENKKAAGVTETPSGLQIKTIKEGTGKSPNDSSVVKCHYRGRLLSGEEFGSSYETGQPAEFSLRGVIPGWTEGIQLMKEGGKYELYVPGKLAYGPRGAGQKIGPNEALIFEVELLEVLPSAAPIPRPEMSRRPN